MHQQLFCVQPELKHVVEEGKERRQREGRNKDGDEAILDHYRKGIFLMKENKMGNQYSITHFQVLVE